MPRERFAAFALTDLVDSTRQWDRDAAAMAQAVDRMDTLAADVVTEAGGEIFKHTGDGFWSVFDSPAAAVSAMAEMQRSLVGDEQLALRAGVHLGHAEPRGGDYFGSTLNRCARVAALAHGGQVLVTNAVAAATGDDLSEQLELVALGTVRLRGLSEPEVVHQLTGPGLPANFPPLPGSADTLPQPLTRLIGRDDVLVDVAGAIDGGQRIATLCGAGGSGKTRLAIELGHRLLPAFPDGVAFVDLSDVGQPEGVRDALAGTLGLAKVDNLAGAVATDRVIESLALRSMLLVLDNCEHVIDAVCELVAEIVAAAPDVRILATSREPLGLTGERVWRVGAMSDDDALALLEERARDANSDFSLHDDERALALEVCRRLDGMPLAIELAAARLRAMSLNDISERLRERFRLLAGGGRTHDRHATLRATLDWSHDLLSEAERTLLARVSVFAGGFALAAAEEVCGYEPFEPLDVLDLLASLVDKSLVVIEQHHGTSRYTMLETVRAYAGDKLAAAGQTDRTNHRHTRWVARLAWDWYGRFGNTPGSDPREHGQLPGELDNLRAAHDRSVAASDASNALGLSASLGILILGELPNEALSRCERSLAIDGGEPFLRIQCLLTAAIATASHMRAPWEHISEARALIQAHGLSEDPVANVETFMASIMDPPDEVPFAERLDTYRARMPAALPESRRNAMIDDLSGRRAVIDGDLEEGLRLFRRALDSGELRSQETLIGTLHAAWVTSWVAYIRIALGHEDALTEADERLIADGADAATRVLLEEFRILRDLIVGRRPALDVDAVVADARRIGWIEAGVLRPIAAMTAARRSDVDVRVALPLLASSKDWEFGLHAAAREALRRRGRAELDAEEFDRVVAAGAELTSEQANSLAAKIVYDAMSSTREA